MVEYIKPFHNLKSLVKIFRGSELTTPAVVNASGLNAQTTVAESSGCSMCVCVNRLLQGHCWKTVGKIVFSTNGLGSVKVLIEKEIVCERVNVNTMKSQAGTFFKLCCITSDTLAGDDSDRNTLQSPERTAKTQIKSFNLPINTSTLIC